MSLCKVEMGICWSEPPQPPVVQSRPPTYIVEKSQVVPTAPPYQAPQYQYQVPQYPPQNYTYAVPYQQPQMVSYYQQRPQYPPQQQQMGVGTAVVGGFLMGAVMEDILDPTE